MPVNRAGVWEQRRVGIASDRRSAVSKLRFRCLTGLPFVCFLDALLAVREEMIADAEGALSERIGADILIAGAHGLPLLQHADTGDTRLVLPLSPGLSDNNRVVLSGGGQPAEEHLVHTATHDPAAGTTTLELASGDVVTIARSAGAGRVSLRVPVIAHAGGGSPDLQAPMPAIVLTLLEVREDPARTSMYTQRDSFRPRPGRVASSVRPAAQAYFIDYQITISAARREQQLFLHGLVLSRLRGFSVTSLADAFRINGAPAPLVLLPSPALEERRLGEIAPIYLRIHTRMEVAPRVEVPGVTSVAITGGLLSAPLPGTGTRGRAGGGIDEDMVLPVAPIPGPEPATPPGVDTNDTEGIVLQVGSG
ncbi:hypothetical protein WME88_33610 [Sorangium sp. So ce216]